MKISNIKLFTLFFFLATTLLHAQEYTLKTKTGEIKGSLLLPEKSEKIPSGCVPLVLLIAGSGPTDRDGNSPMTKNNALKFLAEALQAKNIATLRFDKRGITMSKQAGLKEIDLRFENYVEDVKSWIDTLSKDKRFSKIIVAGHSEGSLIGIISAKNNACVNAFISLEGAGRSADVILKDQLQTQPKSIQELVFPMIDKLKKGDTLSNVSPLLYALFRPSVQPYMISWFKYNPAEEISKLTIPILLIQGTTDIQVKEEDVNLLAKANQKAEKIVIQTMNHVLKNCETLDQQAQMSTYTNAALPIKTELIEAIEAFIRKL